MSKFDQLVCGAQEEMQERIIEALEEGTFDYDLDVMPDSESDVLGIVSDNSLWDSSDVLHEVCDSHVPVYNSERAEILAECPDVAYIGAEEGFEPTGDIFQDIAIGIFLKIQEDARDYISHDTLVAFQARAAEIISNADRLEALQGQLEELARSGASEERIEELEDLIDECENFAPTGKVK